MANGPHDQACIKEAKAKRKPGWACGLSMGETASTGRPWQQKPWCCAFLVMCRKLIAHVTVLTGL